MKVSADSLYILILLGLSAVAAVVISVSGAPPTEHPKRNKPEPCVEIITERGVFTKPN
jgi:hypothetical protein